MSSGNSKEIIKNILRTNRKFIINEIEDFAKILETLYEKELLGKRQYQEIKSKSIQIDAVACLLDCVEQSGMVGFFSFCDALKEDYPWVEKRLLTEVNKKGLQQSSSEQGPIEGSNTVNGNTLYVIEKDLDEIPTERQLLQICKSFSATDFEVLGLELGLTSNEIDCCRHGSGSLIMQAHNILVFWQREKGNDATFRNLIIALDSCDLQHVIHRIKDILS